MASTMQESTGRKPAAAKRTRRGATPKLRVPTHDEIALRARTLYEQSGYQGGRDTEFWLEAERQLRDELKA